MLHTNASYRKYKKTPKTNKQKTKQKTNTKKTKQKHQIKQTKQNKKQTKPKNKQTATTLILCCPECSNVHREFGLTKHNAIDFCLKKNYAQCANF